MGAAVVALNENMEVVESQQVHVGPMDRGSIHAAELIGIFHARSMVYKIAHQRTGAEDREITATILCHSRSALQAIQNVKKKSGQRIVQQGLPCAFSGCQDIVITPVMRPRT